MKKSIIIILTILILIFISVFIFIILPSKKVDKDGIPEHFTIYYTYGGGFGTRGDTISKEVEINSNGHIKIKVDKSENIKPLEYNIKEEKVKELYKYLIDNGFEKLKKDLSNDKVMDGGTEYIEIKSDKLNKKVGGYAATTNEKFSKLQHKIVDTIGLEKMQEFDEKVKKILDNE